MNSNSKTVRKVLRRQSAYAGIRSLISLAAIFGILACIVTAMAGMAAGDTFHAPLLFVWALVGFVVVPVLAMVANAILDIADARLLSCQIE